MAIPSKQIGQPSSTKAGLLWQISKQLQSLIGVAAGSPYFQATNVTITTSTTTTVAPSTTTTTTTTV